MRASNLVLENVEMTFILRSGRRSFLAQSKTNVCTFPEF